MTCKDQYDSFEKGRTVDRKPGEIFTAFKATASVDKNEGRFGGTETLGVFFTMSIDGNAYECGSLIKMVSDAEVRERAMAKVKGVLSEEEQKALGLRR